MGAVADTPMEGTQTRKALCCFCRQHCGIVATVKDGKVLNVEGDPRYPANAGALCSRGLAALEHLEHPARINHPLKRVGAKGGNSWQKISWQQALAEIAERLNRIKAESGAEAVATAGGTLRTEDWARRRFMNLFGSPNSFHNALLCWIPTFMMETAVCGWSPFEADISTSRCVILWGTNPAASNLPGMRMIHERRRAGMKVMVVDPRYSETAAQADLWLPLKPGSDTALSLAMLNVIVEEKLYDADFVERWCLGFDELAAHIRHYTPEWAAPLTRLDASLIRQAARLYATNTPGNIQWGCTADQLGSSSSAGAHARAIMRAICGNLDRPGGDCMPGPALAYLCDEEMEANTHLPEEQRRKQIGSDRYRLTTWPGYRMISERAKATWGKAPTAEWMCEAHGPSVFQAILTGRPYPVRALLVSATNPVSSYADARTTLRALKQVEFLVTCDFWMTPAALYSDYVLPVAGGLERPTLRNYYGVTDSLVTGQRAIAPLHERRADYDIWRGLGLACGQGEELWPWETLEDAYRHMLLPLRPDLASFDEFVETQRIYAPPPRYRKPGDAFHTPSGCIELKSSVLEKLGYPPLPTYEPGEADALGGMETSAEYPLVLTTGGAFMPYHHSEHFNIPAVRYLRHEPQFTLNPKKAAELGIKPGDWCWIETRRGRIRQRARVEQSVAEDVVFVERGWWYPERGANGSAPFGCLESNANVLVGAGESDCDPLTGSWATRGLACRVRKVQPDEDGDAP